jgi:hypothetical protein
VSHGRQPRRDERPLRRSARHATRLHCAKVTLRGRGDRATRVAVFDGSVLATAVVSAPEIMVKSVGDALNGFRDLGDENRETLVDRGHVMSPNYVWRSRYIAGSCSRVVGGHIRGG